jgi:hypothetical protein
MHILLTILRRAFIGFAILSILATLWFGSLSNVDASGNPNPFSTEYGGPLQDWVASVVLAGVLGIPALLLARGRSRWLLLALMVVVGVFQVEPARHYYAYFKCAEGPTAAPCAPVNFLRELLSLGRR